MGSPFRYVFYVPGTAGNNNRIQMFFTSDVLYCDVYDSAGTQKRSSVAAAYNADTNYPVRMSNAAGGVIQSCFDGVCDATPGTGATTDGIGSELNFCGTNTASSDIWIQDPVISRRLI